MVVGSIAGQTFSHARKEEVRRQKLLGDVRTECHSKALLATLNTLYTTSYVSRINMNQDQGQDESLHSFCQALGFEVCETENACEVAMGAAKLVAYVDPHTDIWESITVSVRGEKSVATRFNPDFLMAIRCPEYAHALKYSLNKNAPGRTGLNIHIKKVASMIAERFPDLIAGDVSKILIEENYREISERLDWAFVPLVGKSDMEVVQHPLIYAKYIRGDMTWMTDYIKRVINKT